MFSLSLNERCALLVEVILGRGAPVRDVLARSEPRVDHGGAGRTRSRTLDEQPQPRPLRLPLLLREVSASQHDPLNL
jgi:hypothetical protein